MKPTVNRQAITVAAIVAVSLLLLAGGAYRMLAAHLARPAGTVLFERGTLARRLSTEIGEWRGKDKDVKETIVQAADCDDYVSRIYRRGGEAVQLWIAFGVHARDLMPHRPEVCYPGNGWTLQDTEAVTLPIEGFRDLECRLYRFTGGTMGAATMTVLNYYIVDGQYSPDVSLLRAKAWRGQGGIRYMAQIQIVCSSGARAAIEAAEQAVQAFGAASAEPILACMPKPPAMPAQGDEAPGPARQADPTQNRGDSE